MLHFNIKKSDQKSLLDYKRYKEAYMCKGQVKTKSHFNKPRK